MSVRFKLMLFGVVALLVFPNMAGGELKPFDVSPPGVSGSEPRVASDGAGNVITVWREVDGDQSSIRAALRAKGAAFEPAKRISVPAAEMESPELAMDRLGNAVAVWHRSTGRDSIVQAAVRPARGEWSEPQDLSAPGDVAIDPDVAVEAGRVTAVWTAIREHRPVVQASSRLIDGPWEAVKTLAGAIGKANPVVAMDDRGGAVVAWQAWDGAFQVVQADLRSDDGSWSPPETLSGPGRGAERARVAMDANGNALVGWLRHNGSWFAAQLAYRPAGGAWGLPQNLTKRGGNAAGLELAMNRRGDAVVTWVQGVLTASADLWSAFRPAGARSWARAPVTDNWYGLQARVAIDEAGNATAVWGGWLSISASFKPMNERWQNDYLLSSYDYATAHPAVTTQTVGEATAIWVRAGSADDRIQAVFYDVNSSREAAEEEGEEEEEEEDEEEATTQGLVVKGTQQADTLVGTPGNDVFYGYGGNDLIDGRGGRDIVYGGPGRDRIAGGPGADLLIGGSHADRIVGGRGRDVLHGGSGNDRLLGGSGGDRLFGGAGRDRISGNRGHDVLSGGSDKDVLRGNSGNDALRALDRSADTVFGGRGFDSYRLDRWLDRARSIESRL